MNEGLTEREKSILLAKPLDSEPDRAKIEWPKVEPKIIIRKCIKCGKVDEANPYRILCPNGMGMRSRNDICVLEGEAKP
ncbi:MAG: hypothetical protein QXL57_02400 [Candidatus Bathyarchaeia archaeon]